MFLGTNSKCDYENDQYKFNCLYFLEKNNNLNRTNIKSTNFKTSNYVVFVRMYIRLSKKSNLKNGLKIRI